MDHILQQLNLNPLLEKLQGWISGTLSFLPNIVMAALVMAFSLVASRYIKKYATRLINRLSSNLTINNLLANMATSGFLLIMLFIVLSILELDTALTSLLAGAGVVGLAVGLAVQEPLTNVFSGILISTKSLYNVGDLIKTNGFYGTIQSVSLRSTVLRTLSGQEVLIPNKMILQNPLTNFTSSGERRVELSGGVSYGDNLAQVKEVTLKTVRECVSFKPSRPVEFFFMEFGDSSINFVVRFWIDQFGEAAFLEARSQVILNLKKAFDEQDITIPFPIRTLDFGIKGGKTLRQVLPASRLSINADNEKGSRTAAP